MDLSGLLGPFAWLVHVAAGFAIPFIAMLYFSPVGRSASAVLRVLAVVTVLSVLGAPWLVHPAAGMLLGYFGSRAFSHWRESQGGLMMALVAAAAFMALGATWLIFPLFFMALGWVLSGGPRRGGRRSRRRRAAQPAADIASALPEQASGTPVNAVAAVVDGPLAAFVRDERLPPEARAQLAALNLRTREALDLLRDQGQDGSEAGYVARAVREEYAPAAVQAYLKLPRSMADITPLQDGKTGRALLAEQLEILLDGVQDIMNTALRTGGQELLTHGRFLRERFAKIPEELKVK
ncbi:hypothetical protein LAJ19_06050 [Deinococcus taeanensis]|uniref:hypothetical protein n=1 Tax=Deinococcus taeanensis TaxID=2737050 RepID=UPI001CDD0259|nr:hypothetical protein [Deinococcus taeanensis]UBV44002.1 hypothetical protein LAJ19_06050 [Deinococcus taeanensis]